MSQPQAQTTRYTAVPGAVSITPPQGFALSVFFKLIATTTTPPEDTYHYWIAVADTSIVNTDYDGSVVVRVDVPSQLVPEAGTAFFQTCLDNFHASLPPGPPIIR